MSGLDVKKLIDAKEKLSQQSFPAKGEVYIAITPGGGLLVARGMPCTSKNLRWAEKWIQENSEGGVLKTNWKDFKLDE